MDWIGYVTSIAKGSVWLVWGGSYSAPLGWGFVLGLILCFFVWFKNKYDQLLGVPEPFYVSLQGFVMRTLIIKTQCAMVFCIVLAVYPVFYCMFNRVLDLGALRMASLCVLYTAIVGYFFWGLREFTNSKMC